MCSQQTCKRPLPKLPEKIFLCKLKRRWRDRWRRALSRGGGGPYCNLGLFRRIWLHLKNTKLRPILTRLCRKKRETVSIVPFFFNPRPKTYTLTSSSLGSVNTWQHLDLNLNLLPMLCPITHYINSITRFNFICERSEYVHYQDNSYKYGISISHK